MKLKHWVIPFFILIFYVPLAHSANCDYGIEVLLDGSEFNSSGFSWKMRAARISGDTTNISAAAKIEDSNGNIIKTYKPWTNAPISRQKTSSSYSPKMAAGSYRIISEIEVECYDNDMSNNADAREFTIKNPSNESQTQSNSENQAGIQDSYSQDNFSQSAANGIEKSNTAYSNEIFLSGEPANSNEVDMNAMKTQLVYESSNQKSKKIVLFALLGFSIALNIILIWKR